MPTNLNVCLFRLSSSKDKGVYFVFFRFDCKRKLSCFESMRVKALTEEGKKSFMNCNILFSLILYFFCNKARDMYVFFLWLYSMFLNSGISGALSKATFRLVRS